MTPEVEANDLAQIIDAVGGGPADVFGSSGGAVAGLALVANHPDKVGTLIAHEPPVGELLPDAAQARAGRRRDRGGVPRVRIRGGLGQVRLPGDARRPDPRRRPAARHLAAARAMRAARGRGPTGAVGQAAGRRRDVLPPHAEAVHPLPAADRGPAVGAARRGRGRCGAPAREMARRSADALAERLGQTADRVSR